MVKRTRQVFNDDDDDDGYKPDYDCNSDTEIYELNIIMNKIKEEKKSLKKLKKELNSIELDLSSIKII